MERNSGPDESEALDLRYYAGVAYRHLWILVLLPLLLTAAAYFNANRETRMYSATSQVLLRPNDPNERLGSSDVAVNQVTNIDQYVRSQGNLARSPEIRNAVATKLGVDAKTIEQAVAVSPLIDSNTLQITATAKSPAWSVQVANTVATEYINNRRDYARAGLERAIGDIDAKITDIEKQLTSLTTGSSTDPNAQAQLQTATQQFQELTTRKYELAIDVSLKNGEAELIAQAEQPTGPVSPRPLRSGILGGMLGVLLAVGIVLLKDRFDTRLRSREEAEYVTSLPALGELPFDKLTQKQLVAGVAATREPDGLLAEAIRSLRVSLRFLSLEKPMQVLLVTSPTPGDGKSTTSVNLAASYAVAGQRTLLVSGDLRRPQSEQLTGVPSGPGFVELLTEIAVRREQNSGAFRSIIAGAAAGSTGGNGVSTNGTTEPVPAAVGGGAARRRRPALGTALEQEAAKAPLWITEWCHADEAENLWVLPAGQPVANPVEILGSIATRDFFDLAREQFDIVIVDSPPVIAVSDPVVMSPYVDGVVVICALRKTTRTALQRATEILDTGHARVLGLVVNLVPTRKRYSGYYYSSTQRTDRVGQ